MAIEDNYVRKNLFDFQLSEVIEDASRPKTALSKVQEARLLDLYSHASDAENARSVA
ncbi:transposase [Clostridioides difficile]|nr:transposase [Clostridioides difficile]OFT99612.1 transposase [Clostridium sp. HMSC19E03]OFU19137.1 transposase [Clostridium sp. HMSC19C09]OFU21413.1 transposase [Clostridium sp. HMSC19C05]OFU21810.1 transposase [Clostridium sp. HMSC19C08]OFU31630.1 transposase [Clostridium sp. HMSC19B10]OFU38184.1 transposase [Clostridium sp. HMSC19B01]